MSSNFKYYFAIVVAALFFISNVQAQNFYFGNFAAAEGCYDGDYSFNTTVKVTGIKVNTIYYDNPAADAGSFGFDVIFEYSNQFSGTLPVSASTFWEYQLAMFTSNTNISSASISNNFYGVPLNTHIEGGVNFNNNKSYNGSAANLGLQANTLYTDPAIIQMFGYDSATISVQSPCISTSRSAIIDNTPLAVGLSHVAATYVAGITHISWTTVSESNNEQFIIERSTAGDDWEAIGLVYSKAQNGNSDEVLQYTFRDLTPLAGVNLYRILSKDLAGSYVYSKVVLINNAMQASNLVVFPNPAIDFIQIKGLLHEATLQVYDLLGNRRLTKIIPHSEGGTPIALNDLSNGMYVMYVNVAGKVEVAKFTIQR